MQDTIHNLLKQTISAKPFATGFDTFIFALPAPFSDYLLKIPGNPKEKLSATTSLTPIDYGLRRSLGQPVIGAGDDIQFIIKSPGKSLRSLVGGDKDFSTLGEDTFVQTQEQLLQKVLHLPVQSFVPLLEDVKHLNEHGYIADFHPGNILLSGKKLHLVDAVEFSSTLPMDTDSVDALSRKGWWLTGEQVEAQRPLIEQINAKMHSANHAVGLPDNDGYLYSYRKAHPIQFVPPVKIDHIGTIPLSATPQELREHLNATEQYLGMPFK